MFYSQFILAKKGPLGTIWIAAHLERKLRKNQVADTDIGVSVDSIICPEVPIALRLSSHLLLGVVRIYSKKVNYLFHDCSEALLKIKQAFRSTAVDLPPEESTAPYHSITLPETFDLDDFELPDAVLHGNFVDHHVSTREQITLQDRVENTLYTATQFGLDERFGDGDTSQIGLDLDEGLFLKKDSLDVNASVPAEKSSVENQLSAQPETPFTPFVNMDVDDHQFDSNEHKAVEGSTNIAFNSVQNFGLSDDISHGYTMVGSSSNLQGYNIQTPDLNEMIVTGGEDIVQNCTIIFCPANEGSSKDFLGPAQAPSTPGLLEEAIPVHLQDGNFSHQGKSSPSNEIEDVHEKMQIEVEGRDSGNKIGNPSLTSQCSDMPLKGVVEPLMEACERNSGSVMNGVLRDESPDRINLDSLYPKGPAEADNFKGSSRELFHAESAPLTSYLAVHDDKLALTWTSEINHSMPIEKPELLNSTQSKPAVVMDYSLNDQMVTLDLGFPLKPCSRKNQINSVVSEDQVLGDINHQLMKTFSVEKTPQDVDSSLQKGEGFCSSSSTGNIYSTNNFYGSSEHPGTERVTVPSTSSHGYPNATEQYVAGQRMLEQGVKSQLTVDHHPEPQRATVVAASTHGFPNETEHYISGRRMLEPVSTSHTCDGQSVLARYSEPEKVVVASSSTSCFLNESEEFIAGQRMLELVGTSGTCNSQSAVEYYSQPEIAIVANGSIHDFPNPKPQRSMMANTSTHNFPNETEKSIVEQGMLEPGGPSVMGHYLEPERAMLTSTSAHIFQNVSEQSTTGREPLKIDRSTLLNHSLSSQVLSFGEGSPALLNGSSGKLPGLQRSKRKAAYIPDDDDLLATILVGKKRTFSNMKDTPPFQLVPSSKHPRLTPKHGVPKRKVLIDDTMVLHADIIRQQLINTDDLRRMRKKAPCTCLETWMIRKSSLEDEIFSESVLAGMSPVLASFQYQLYNHNGIAYPPSYSKLSPLNAPKVGLPMEPELPPSSFMGSNNFIVSTPAESELPPGFTGPGNFTVSTPVESEIPPGFMGSSNLAVDTSAESELPLSAFMGPSNFSVSAPEKDYAGVSVESISHSTIEMQHESGHVAIVHGGTDHTINLKDTTLLNSSSDTLTCSVVSLDTCNNDYGSGGLVINVDSVSAQTCSINDTPLDKGREASTVTADNELVLNPRHKSFEETVHQYQNKKDGTSIPFENASSEDGPHVVESRCALNDRDNNVETSVFKDRKASSLTTDNELVLNPLHESIEEIAYQNKNGDTSIPAENGCSIEDSFHVLENRSAINGENNNVESSIAILSEEWELSSQRDPFVENHTQHEADQMDLDETDGGSHSSENTSVIIDGMQQISVGKENVVEVREQKMHAAVDVSTVSLVVDDKVMSLPVDTAISQCENSLLPTSDVVTSTLGEIYVARESNLESNIHMENAEEAGATMDSNDSMSAVDENDHDTEFLNINDEVDFDEEVDYEIPNPTEDPSLENSGWSTRTRGVARYLKMLFDEETGYGRKSIHLDRLLAGKNRKEASRMFFETLVLKTRDYVHVEQDSGFGSISIEPRSKLLKSTF